MLNVLMTPRKSTTQIIRHNVHIRFAGLMSDREPVISLPTLAQYTDHRGGKI